MTLNYALFPLIGKERELPIYNVSIGINICQYHVTRPEGYWYDQFIYSTHGSGTLIADNKTIHISPNTVFFLPRNMPHEYYSESADWDTRWLTPSGAALDRLFSLLGFQGLTLLPLRDVTPLDAILERMHNLIVSDRISGNFYASAYVYEFLMELHRLSHETQAQSGSSANLRLLPVIEYIDLHFTENITLNTLSSMIKVTPQHLCRMFRDSLGMRPLEYVSQKRIRAAQDYLASTSKPISEISVLCGYDNMNYFYRMFRKYVGVTPAAYRLNVQY